VTLVLALGTSGSALGAPLGQIGEFPTTTTASSPEGIVAGPDGNLWFAEAGANKIAEINPLTHAVTEFSSPTGSSFPLGVALGPDGNIWFTEFDANKIGVINPITHAVTDFSIPPPATGGPVAIVAGSDGNLWFTESRNPGELIEINPNTDAFTEFPAPTANLQPFGITSGPDGNIWFTEKTNPGKIGFIDPSTHTTGDFATKTADSAPNAITSGPDGSLWFTEQDANNVVKLDPATHVMTEIPTPTPGPVVITTGPDGNMWFTETGPGKVAFVNPVTDDITEFATPTANSGPIGIATGADGNLWFTDSLVAKIGVVGAGAPAASIVAPSVGGAPQPGNTLTCNAGMWSSWAGQQPSLNENGFDGFSWRLNGQPIAGATSSSFTVAGNDSGGQISCQETVTYPLVGTTATAASGPVTVSPSPGASSPPLGASLSRTSLSGDMASLTIACQGPAGQTCGGPVTLSSRVTAHGSKTTAVAAKAKRKPKPPPKKVSKTVTVASGSYSVASGQSTAITLRLNSAGQKLLNRFYRLPASLAIGGTTPITKSVSFSYERLHISPHPIWVFTRSYSYATKLTLPKLPSQAKTTVTCRGRGCPFSKRTFSTPKHGTLDLAPALKHRHLVPPATVEVQISAPNDIAEVVIFTINTNKHPSEAFRCLAPTAHSPTRCA
jgi:streptogramin lyase